MKPTAILAILLLFSATLLSQSTYEERDVVQELMPGGVPPKSFRLTAAQKTRVIKQLQAAQKQATGRRGQQIAFLLAALGSKYENNRDYLVQALQGCSIKPIRNDCNEDTAVLLMALYHFNHHEVLGPLFVAGATSDAALSEALGSFYSDILTQNSFDFVKAIRLVSKATQNQICFLAGSADGGGMTSSALRKARKQLGAVGDEVALGCLQQIEKANVVNSETQ